MPGGRFFLNAAFALTLLLTLGYGRTAAASPAGADQVRFGDAAGIHVVGVRRLDDRQYDLKVSTAALRRTVDLRLLLPAGYLAHPTTRYPVLYLMPGTNGRASDWVTAGDAEATTARLPVITVMPDAGFDGDGGGWFTDWFDPATRLGPSKWETFHIGQLVPWVDHTLRTVAARDGRAIAGLSQGGFGAMSYAARHPDLFVSAASFSGAPDIDYNPAIAAGATLVIGYVAQADDGVSPDAIFGSRLGHEINWQGHDPADLAPNLRGMDLYLYTATGLPGPLDPPPGPDPRAVGIEFLSHLSTLGFRRRLDGLGIPSHLDDYTFGTHTFPYWARDLRQYAGPLMKDFARPPRRPRPIGYESIDPTWSQWGWTVSLDRAEPQRFSVLSEAGPGGFTLRGSGRATVTTPAYYRPGSTAEVTVTTPSGSRTVRLTASRAGRLTVTFRLAAADTTAQVTVRGTR